MLPTLHRIFGILRYFFSLSYINLIHLSALFRCIIGGLSHPTAPYIYIVYIP